MNSVLHCGYLMVTEWYCGNHPPPLFKKNYLSNNESHFYSEYTQKRLTCALLVELHIAVVFENPQEGHSMLSALYPISSIGYSWREKDPYQCYITIICRPNKLAECVDSIAYKMKGAGLGKNLVLTPRWHSDS